MGSLPKSFGVWGLIFSIVLVAVWLFMIKGNILSIVSNPQTRRTTLWLLLPAVILFAGGFFFAVLWPRLSHNGYGPGSGGGAPGSNNADPIPRLAHLYFANYSSDTGKVQVCEKTYWFPPFSKYSFVVQSNQNTEKLRAWVGELLVIDTLIGVGRYIGSFSKDSYVIAEQVGYRATGDTTRKQEELPVFIVSEPGIERFDKEFAFEVFDFETEVPRFVYENGNAPKKWDIKALDDASLRWKYGLPEADSAENDYERDE